MSIKTEDTTPADSDTDASKPLHGRWWANRAYDRKPQDGPYAWMVAAAGCFILMFSMGCVNSYGAYQTYYMGAFPRTPISTLSWIGTLQFAVMNFFSIPAGILCERLDSRLVTLMGGLIMGVSLIIASFVDDAVWKLLVTQGIVFGIGAAFAYIPAISVPSQWFDKYRPLAIGLVVSGSGIGGLWLVPATDHMIQNLGTAWSLRITGFIVLFANTLASPFMRNRLQIPPRDKIIDFGILKDPRFLILFAGVICSTTAYFTPFFNMPSFAVRKLGHSIDFGNNLVTILNATSTVGRITTGMVAVRLGSMNTLAGCSLVAALSILVLWLPFETTGTVVASACIYGFFCGGFISLTPVVIAELWGVQRIATIVGLGFIACFIGAMVGAPSSGAILDHVGHGTNYKPGIAFCGAFMAASFVFFVLLRICKK